MTTPPPIPKPASKKKWWFLGCGCLVLIAIVAAAILIGIIGGVSIIAYLLPDAKIENIQITSDSRVINGEFDYGELVSFDLKSIRDAPKDVPVRVTLTCSEGEWSQNQKVHLAPNESKHLTFFFAEPTVSVQNVKAQVQMVSKVE